MPPTEHELRLRERLGRLRNLPLLGGAKISGELDRLQRQIVADRRGGDRRGDLAQGRARTSRRPAVHARLRRAPARRLVRAARRPRARRRRRDDRRPRQARRQHRRPRGPAEGTRHPRAREPAVRDAEPRGLPQGDGTRWSWPSRHGFPVVSLVDTPGAYPGVVAEQHGQGAAIARSQATMARLKVPTVACVIGEGGSGGAIAIALADQVLMQENAIYSVISPEGCAAILWRDAGQFEEGCSRVPARRDPLSRARSDRRDRPGAGGRGAHRSRPGGAAARTGATRIPCRAGGDSGRRSAPPPPRALPLARRLRLSRLRQFYGGLIVTGSASVHTVHRLIPALYSLCKRREYDSRLGKRP